MFFYSEKFSNFKLSEILFCLVRVYFLFEWVTRANKHTDKLTKKKKN